MPLDGIDSALHELDEKSSQLARAVSLDGQGRLVRKTPVKTGRARNNWNLARGSVDAATTPEGEYPKDGGQAIARGRVASESIQAGDTVFITNALPYIGPLEEGHSKQAPQGMIAVTVAEMDAAFPGLVRQVRAGR